MASTSQPDDRKPDPSVPVQATGDASNARSEIRQLTSEELFAGRQEIEIQHDGEQYRLRITRNGKLILHK
ncbi:hemin uptake protein HemP [bacterium]|nr:hemin uptake protein HemP [bacterium]